MQVFRKKYLYNPQNPIFESDNVQTFNCMNTQTKNNKLIIIRHLKDPPFVDPSPGILQPIEQPTTSEPFSIYPLVYCCSEIGHINESDAMYIIKCLLQAKVKDPLYCVLSPQGICVSEVQGLLPNRSPSIFEIAVQILGIPATLNQTEEIVVSREAFSICKGIRDGASVTQLLSNYGWTNPKKEKNQVKDEQFWIFKGKRKEEGSFGDQYSLAWFSKFGLARFRFIDLSKDGYQDQFLNDYMKKINFYKNNEEKKVNTVEIYKFVKEAKGIKIFTQILNQGTLTQYLSRREQLGKAFTQRTAMPMLQNFVKSMQQMSQQQVRAHGALHGKLLYVHSNRIVIGQPLFVTDKMQKKVRDLKTTFDYYAPQMKENIILPENFFKLDQQKMDMWSFGFVLHKVITRDLPAFDPTRKPMLNRALFSPGMHDLIMRCLSLTPAQRPGWEGLNLRDLEVAVVIQPVEQQAVVERQVIRLGTAKESSTKARKVKKERLLQQQQVIHVSSQKIKEQQEQKLKEEQQDKFLIPIPVELSLRLKKIKMVAKIIIIMILYIFVFFRQFISNSFSILLVRSYYGTTSLNLVDSSSSVLSTTVIITHQPNFFLLNDISFSDVQNVYNCITDQFDPIYNPSYSLLSYVQSPSFLALLLTGWATLIIICVIKCVSIWKGGLSNRPNKNLGKYFVVYGFHQLSLAALLFAHFFIYQFFYFAGGTPCFSIKTYQGIQPFFDSSLYLFLMNTDGYLRQVFSTLGVLAIFVLISSCYYACGPKLDQKYCLSVPSIVFRIIPYLLFIVICRVGVFMLFAPSALNDTSSIIPAIMSGTAVGTFGILPQIFILICVTVQALMELFFYWCERKAAQSDKLARLFNIRAKKTTNLQESQAALNDMSMAKNAKDEMFA